MLIPSLLSELLQGFCTDFALYFKEEVDNIQCGLKNDKQNVSCCEVVNVCSQSNVTCKFSEFKLVSEDDVTKLIKEFAAKHCLLDCIATRFLKDSYLTFVPG